MNTDTLIQDLKNLLTEGILSQNEDDLTAHETDTWPLRMVEKTIGHVLEGPLCVIKPANTAEVSKILTYLNKYKVPVVPYGGGSGVTGGAEPKKESVVIDVSNMKKIIHLDEDTLTFTAQSGVMLRDLETYLKQNNDTGGQFHHLIELAQLAG